MDANGMAYSSCHIHPILCSFRLCWLLRSSCEAEFALDARELDTLVPRDLRHGLFIMPRSSYSLFFPSMWYSSTIIFEAEFASDAHELNTPVARDLCIHHLSFYYYPHRLFKWDIRTGWHRSTCTPLHSAEGSAALATLCRGNTRNLSRLDTALAALSILKAVASYMQLLDARLDMVTCDDGLVLGRTCRRNQRLEWLDELVEVKVAEECNSVAAGYFLCGCASPSGWRLYNTVHRGWQDAIEETG